MYVYIYIILYYILYIILYICMYYPIFFSGDQSPQSLGDPILLQSADGCAVCHHVLAQNGAKVLEEV